MCVMRKACPSPRCSRHLPHYTTSAPQPDLQDCTLYSRQLLAHAVQLHTQQQITPTSLRAHYPATAIQTHTCTHAHTHTRTHSTHTHRQVPPISHSHIASHSLRPCCACHPHSGPPPTTHCPCNTQQVRPSTHQAKDTCLNTHHAPVQREH